MKGTTHTKLIDIGNSKGIRIPKTLIEQYQLQHGIEIKTGKQGLIISPHKQPRTGRGEQFSTAILEGEMPDEDMFEGVSNVFDNKDRKW